MNNNQEQVWKVAKWALVLLTIFLAVISIKELRAISYVGTMPSTNTISVNGKGETISVPDIATFSFSVTENAKTVKEAQDKSAKKINEALDAVKKGGVAEKDIKTLSYNIYPHYDYQQSVCTALSCPPSKSVLNGYDVSQTIQVKVRDLSKAGELFGTIGGVGIQTVDGLSFSIDDIDKVKSVAREEAIKDAKEKAQKIANDLGVSLVRIINYSDSSNDVAYPMYSERTMVMSAKADVTPQVPAGEQKISSNVNITYEIR